MILFASRASEAFLLQAASAPQAGKTSAAIDEELGEHQRWGAASEQVGAAGSSQRAAFIAQAAGGGAMTGFEEGLVQGAKMGAGMKIAEKLVEKGAIQLATRLGFDYILLKPFTPSELRGAVDKVLASKA